MSESDAPDDPVRDGLREEDLYDVATWEERSVVDRLATVIYRGLHGARSAALIAIALVMFVGLFGLGLVFVVQEPILGLLGVLSIVPALVLMGYLWFGDPTTREPLDALAITFILSILFATFAAVLNGLFRPLFDVLPGVGLVLYFFLIVGPIEETVKWLSVRVHAFGRPTFQTVVDGVVYGAVAGLGFAAIENLVYIMEAYSGLADATAAGQLQYTIRTAIGRAIVGPGHVLYSAIAGYYLGLAKFNPERRGPIVVKGLLVAALLHGLYNSVVSFVPFTLLTFVAFVFVFDGLLLVYVLRKVSRYESHYRRVQRGERLEAATDGTRSVEDD